MRLMTPKVISPKGTWPTYIDYITSGVGQSTESAISGDVLYIISADSNNLVSIDISDPWNMLEMQNFVAVEFDWPRGLRIVGTTAFILSDNGSAIISVDISDPYDMVIIQNFTSTSLTDLERMDLNEAGTIAYAIGGIHARITAIDISDPADMFILGVMTSSYLLNASDISVSGNIAIVVSPIADSVASIDISNPQSMSIMDFIDTYPIFYRAVAVEIVGDIAHIVSDSYENGIDKVGAFISLDISDPGNLVVLEKYYDENTRGVVDLAISGDIAILVCSAIKTNIISFDISDPNSMIYMNYVPRPTDIAYSNISTRVSIKDYVAYTSDTNGFIYSVDIS